MALLDPDQRRILATGATAFRPYDRYGEPIPGLSWIPLSAEAEAGRGCFLLRFAPGSSSRPHEHVGVEEFYVVEGELEDPDGQVMKAGDFVSYAAGSCHYSVSPKGCTILAVLREPNRAIGAEGA